MRYGTYLGRQRGYPLLRAKLVSKAILALLDPQKGDIILEIGCNNGHLLDHVARLCLHSFGIDINKDMVGRLHNKRIIPMDARNLGFASDAFDKIFSSHTLEHIPRIVQVFKEAYRVLKEQGVFVFSFPLEIFQGQSAIRDSVFLYGHPFYARKIHVHRLTPKRVKRMIADISFEVAKTSIRLTPFPECLMKLLKIKGQDPY